MHGHGLHAALLGALIAGCAAPPTPMVGALATGAGYWPENSATGVDGALALDLPALEVDVAWAGDLTPVLHRGAALSRERCRVADGERFDGEVLLRDLPVDALRERYRCGGVPAPEHPQALVIAEPVPRFADLLAAMRAEADPSLLLVVDLQLEPGRSLPPTPSAEAVVGAWVEADLPQRVIFASPHADLLRAVHAAGAARGVTLETARRVDASAPLEGPVGREDLSAWADEAGAEHLLVSVDGAAPGPLRDAADAGIGLLLELPPSPEVPGPLQRRGLGDLWLSAYPGDLP
jgi:glycerophosphoryl diester phosphodiesterase